MLFKFRSQSLAFCQSCKQDVRQILLNLRKDLKARLKEEHNGVANLVRSVANMHPENVMKRGYSITLVNGKPVTHIREVKNRDVLQTRLLDGTVVSNVKDIKTKDQHE
jgi:exodeoxyribonuclease VII large subunit